VAISVLFGPEVSSDGGMTRYYVVLGAGSLVQAAAALALAVRGARAEVRWEANLARAAVLLALVVLLSGAAVVVGALIHDGPVL
jgi:hypothetical protein